MRGNFLRPVSFGGAAKLCAGRIVSGKKTAFTAGGAACRMGVYCARIVFLKKSSACVSSSFKYLF